MQSTTHAAQALAVQGLTAADVEANRAGRVSPKQLELLARMHRTTGRIVNIVLGGTLLMDVIYGVYMYLRTGSAGVFVVTAIMSTFIVALYFLVYRRFRLPLPKEIENARVAVVRGTVTAAIAARQTRKVFNVWIDHVLYTGCPEGVSPDVFSKGRIVTAYVIAERKYFVALEPSG